LEKHLYLTNKLDLSFGLEVELSFEFGRKPCSVDKLPYCKFHTAGAMIAQLNVLKLKQSRVKAPLILKDLSEAEVSFLRITALSLFNRKVRVLIELPH